MTTEEHADRTQRALGLRALDIHKWIDGFFDVEGFELFLRGENDLDFNPYSHRQHRHCREALEEAYREFEGSFTRKQIKAVFESHIKDDYDGYIPCRLDFTNGSFKEKYHERQAGEDKVLSPVELEEYFKGKKYTNVSSEKSDIPAGFFVRIILPAIVALVFFIVFIFVVIVPVFRNVMLKNKKDMIHELVNTAASSINYYIQEEKFSRMTREEAQKAAASEIGKMRYGIDSKDYFWITDMQPVMIMHPYRKDLEGKDLTDYRDSENTDGKHLFVDSVDIVKKDGEGFLTYYWQWMDVRQKTVLKLSYVQGVEEWGWIIGSGIYINDIEVEMSAFMKKLVLIFGADSFIVLIVLMYVVYQSRKIESNRHYFEMGLREAKDRYRALAEASTQGYILEVGGENIFTNKVIQRMLGYSESELQKIKLWELLDQDYDKNKKAEEYLKELYRSKVSPSEFEVRIVAKNNRKFDVKLSTSNLFFSHKNGNLIIIKEIMSHQKELYSSMVTDSPSGMIYQNTMTINHNHDSYIAKDIIFKIKQSSSSAEVAETLNSFPQTISMAFNEGINAIVLRQSVCDVFNNSFLKFIEIAKNNLGKPPADFCFVSLGSNARGEMTLFSDQDNALIFKDTENDLEETRKYFLKLAKDVTFNLNRAGYHYCPGGIIASNPDCCLSLSEWKKKFTRWFEKPDEKSILNSNVFFDFEHVYGDISLATYLKEYIFACAENNPAFFAFFANNALLYKAPITVLGNIKTENIGKKKIINIKQCLKVLEIAARIYALKNKIKESATLTRFEKLYQSKKITLPTFKNVSYDFNYLWNLRFQNQLVLNAELSEINDDLNINDLSEIEIENLKNVILNINNIQNSLSYDFLGRMKM